MKQSFFTPRWIITTLLVIAAVAVMVRLGFWQLDRLAQRRAFNASVEAQINAPALDLNKEHPGALLTGMEYRQVVVRGVYDPQNEVILRNQVNGDQPGYHLLTPLRIDGSNSAVLVDRGFIPLEQGQPADRAQYAQPGEVTVRGIVRVGHVPQFFGVPDPTLTPGQTRLDAWNAANLPRIQKQMPYPILPVYIQAAPTEAASIPNTASTATTSAVHYPIASQDLPDITEGPHLSYAIQWFSFAAILAMGYPYFVKKQMKTNQENINHEGTKDTKG